MTKHYRYSVATSLVIISGMLTFNSQPASGHAEIIATRIYTTKYALSLHSLALQSGLQLAELRRLNNGTLDRRETLKAGESLLLPADSPLFPVSASPLPNLGMSEAPAPTGERVPNHMAGSAHTLGTYDWNNLNSDQVKSQAENWVKNKVKGHVVSPVQQQAQTLLGKFGKAQVGIAVDDRGDFKKSKVSLFTPWFETDAMTPFTQAGVHDQDSRTIGNFGVGIRLNQGKWMQGYNAFLDHDFSRSHNRLGLGAELWTDSLKLAANYYHPLSRWKDSPDLEDYEERPAKGFDLRMQGYLPSYPQLGASVVYEQYYGKEVALFGKENLQKDPKAITVGLDYTPVPLVTLKASHKEGQQGHQAQVDLQVNYQIGVPLAGQLDPDNVAAMRSMMGSRHDLVDRNYDIVLEYREKAGLLTVDLAAVPATLLEGDMHIMQPLVKNKYRITGVDWRGDVKSLSLSATAGNSNPQGWQITLPAWDPSPDATNRYQLAIILTDEKGRQVTSNPVEILVGNRRQGQLVVESAASVPASGQSSHSVVLAAWLENHQKQPVDDPLLQTSWKVTDAKTGNTVSLVKPGESCPLDAQTTALPCLQSIRKETEVREGITHHVIELVSSVPGTFQIKAELGAFGETAPQTVTFTDKSSDRVARAEIHDPDGNDILTSQAAPQVGVTYTVRLFDMSGTDITDSIPEESVRWTLDGRNKAGCDITFKDHDTTIAGYKFTPRTADKSNSGVACGDQGVSLKVSW
ncbi:inverse autotransporter beta domain-containing protein [Lelliottia nimipressuralis]